MLCIVSPGQGAQTTGFLTPWFDTIPQGQEFITSLGTVIDLDLVKHGTESTEETIKDTNIAQPLIVSASLLSFRALLEPDNLFGTAKPLKQTVLAGHSVGEISASVVAGMIEVEEALKFTSARAQAMAEASKEPQTSMAALLGADLETMEKATKGAGAYIANYNSDQQIVAAGTVESLGTLRHNLPEKTRMIELKVSGAFHTPYMSSAQKVLKEYENSMTVSDPLTPLYSNDHGKHISSGKSGLNSLIAQVTSPVYWTDVMKSFHQAGTTGILELAPAGTLTGIIKKSMPEVQTFALKTPDQLPEARQFMADHSQLF